MRSRALSQVRAGMVGDDAVVPEVPRGGGPARRVAARRGARPRARRRRGEAVRRHGGDAGAEEARERELTAPRVASADSE